jgi:hypothetical protein
MMIWIIYNHGTLSVEDKNYNRSDPKTVILYAAQNLAEVNKTLFSLHASFRISPIVMAYLVVVRFLVNQGIAIAWCNRRQDFDGEQCINSALYG